MERIPWWRVMFGGEWFDRQKINEAVDELNTTQSDLVDLDRKVGRLFELDRAQGKEMGRMEVLFGTLVDALVESGALKEPEIRARFETALKALEPKPAPPPPVVKRGEEARRMTTCADCAKNVEVRRTYLTDRGPVCDDCFRASVLAKNKPG